MKKWYLSKSIWVGITTFGYAVLRYLGVLNAELDDATIAAVLGVVSVVLRLFTTEEVVLK